MDTLLISYTTVDFRTKTEMELALRRWDDNKEKWLKKFKDAGMTSNINTQIWNKEGVFRIGRIFMYKDEKAFIACQKIFREFENENSQKSKVLRGVFSMLVQVLWHYEVVSDKAIVDWMTQQ